jgi:hypothetical protein
MKSRLFEAARKLLLVGTAGVALAALPLAAQDNSVQRTTTSERDRSATGGTGDYGSSADYTRGTNWGWIGILGLVGLLGLRGASRANYDDYRTRPGPA